MHEILTTEQMGEVDRRAVVHGVASLTLMETAGRAVASEAGQMLQPGRRVLVLCGPGNNGGDGFVAARYLKQRGFSVRVACLVPVANLKGDAAAMAAKWMPLGPVESFPDTDDAAASVAKWPDLVIDAIFGAGFQRTLPVPAALLIGALLSEREVGRGVLKLAVDVPSGLIGNTGETPEPGSIVLPADVTVTFQRLKPAHVCGSGKFLCGRVMLADIGIPAEAIADIDATRAPRFSANDPALWLTCVQRFENTNARHKYVNGHAVVVSGPPHRTGAARLAARAALRAGAGLVTLLSRPDAVAINASHATAVMVDAIDDAAQLRVRLDDPRINVVVIGPGLGTGEAEQALVEATLDTHDDWRTWVFDADALTIFARNPELLFETARRQRTQTSAGWNEPRIVLTPHEGEFDRLFGKANPGQSKIDRTLDAAERSHCIVVFKGADTVVACPARTTADGDVPPHAIVNTNAPSHLATAGSGDVLAGLIAGVLAHNPPGRAFDAAAAAVWMHGAGATLFGPGLIAEDLPETMPRVLNDLARRWATFRRNEDAQLRAATRSP